MSECDSSGINSNAFHCAVTRAPQKKMPPIWRHFLLWNRSLNLANQISADNQHYHDNEQDQYRDSNAPAHGLIFFQICCVHISLLDGDFIVPVP
jgi:hypothetical protein